MRKIILASGSPRRKKLLEQVGLEFEVVVSNVNEEEITTANLFRLAELLSQKKAEAVAHNYKDAVIIAADTTVVLGNKILGKPNSKQHAKEMLKALSGQKHAVVTGFTILDTKTNKQTGGTSISTVFMRKVTEEEIDWYIETNEPMDKAGAYGIQEKGARFIEKVEGDYNGVIGLPLFAVLQTLEKFGIKVT